MLTIQQKEELIHHLHSGIPTLQQRTGKRVWKDAPYEDHDWRLVREEALYGRDGGEEGSKGGLWRLHGHGAYGGKFRNITASISNARTRLEWDVDGIFEQEKGRRRWGGGGRRKRPRGDTSG